MPLILDVDAQHVVRGPNLAAGPEIRAALRLARSGVGSRIILTRLSLAALRHRSAGDAALKLPLSQAPLANREHQFRFAAIGGERIPVPTAQAVLHIGDCLAIFREETGLEHIAPFRLYVHIASGLEYCRKLRLFRFTMSHVEHE